MKMRNWISVFSKKGLMLATAALVMLGSVFMIPGAAAQSDTPENLSPLSLASRYQHEQKWLNVQQTNLGLAEGIATSVQNLITEAQAKNINTSAISAALGTFQSQLSAADSSHASAAAILAAHNGFDDSGNVTDRLKAWQTVQDASAALLNAHNILVLSTRNLFNALKTWEKSNSLLTQIQALEVAFANEQAWLSGQQTNLGKAATLETNVENLISVAQSNGFNTAALSIALTTFQGQIATAQAAHTTADGILSLHAGFDDSGNVTDASAAATTVKTAGQSLTDAHKALVQASSNMLSALKKWGAKAKIGNFSQVSPAFKQAMNSALDLSNSVHVENGPHISILDTRLNNLLNALLKELS